jgi:hypothetical protein
MQATLQSSERRVPRWLCGKSPLHARSRLSSVDRASKPAAKYALATVPPSSRFSEEFAACSVVRHNAALLAVTLGGLKLRQGLGGQRFVGEGSLPECASDRIQSLLAEVFHEPKRSRACTGEGPSLLWGSPRAVVESKIDEQSSILVGVGRVEARFSTTPRSR